MIQTIGWVHKVLLLDGYRTRRSRLIHLEEGLARILPGGGFINVAVKRKDDKRNEYITFNFISTKFKLSPC